MKTRDTKFYDLAVIGMGMAGMSAALFAANRGLSVVQAGNTGELVFSSGLFDVMAVHPIESGKCRDNPWQAIHQLTQDIPHHPYAAIPVNLIKASMEELMETLKSEGVPYVTNQGDNSRLVTSMGTVKTSWGIPETMWNGVRAFKEKRPTLMVEFNRLKGFSARQISETMKSGWSGLKSVVVDFPDAAGTGEVFAEQLARQMDNPSAVMKLAEILTPHLKGVEFLGLPPVLGMYSPQKVRAQFETLTGVNVFEIPSMPPSVPGLRVKEALERALGKKGVRQYFQNMVTRVTLNKDGTFCLNIGGEGEIARARGIILASGRFMGKGLRADRDRIRETLLDIPVSQPVNRDKWHSKQFFDPSGHAVNLAGIEADRAFRPVNQSGQQINANLYAVGSILAHQDWKRMKCGTGLAASTAFQAVSSCIEKSFSGTTPYEGSKRAS